MAAVAAADTPVSGVAVEAVAAMNAAVAGVASTSHRQSNGCNGRCTFAFRRRCRQSDDCHGCCGNAAPREIGGCSFGAGSMASGGPGRRIRR